MKKINALLLLLCTSAAFCQEKKGYSRLVPAYSLQRYYDVNSVRTDGKSPENTINPNNTFSHYFGLHYERVTKSGIIFGGGLQYGVRKFDIDIYQDLSKFDQQAKFYLQGEEYRRKIRASVSYWAPRVMGGYRWQYNKKWAVSGTLGVSLKKYVTRARELNRVVYVSYFNDSGIDMSTYFLQADYAFGGYFVRNGNIFSFGRTSGYTVSVPCLDIYLGVERKCNFHCIKSLSLGVEMIRAISFLGRWKDRPSSQRGELFVYARDNVTLTNEADFSKDTFFDRSISVGLRVGVGLWR